MSAAWIAVQRIGLVVVTTKNIVDRVTAETGQRDLSTVLHVVFLVDVVLGHNVIFDERSTWQTKCAIRMERVNRYINAQTDVKSPPQVDFILSEARLHSDLEGKMNGLIYITCNDPVNFSPIALALDLSCSLIIFAIISIHLFLILYTSSTLSLMFRAQMIHF